MGDLKLTSASGSVTLSPENVAGTTTITLPSSTATLATNENFTSTGIDDNATSTAITIDSSENVSVDTGNLVIGTSGKGIDFSAYGAGANIDSNLLDDYEEGTFVLTSAAGSGTLTLNTAYDDGYYTKVGNLVTFNCSTLIFTTATTPSGSLTFSGLPFTCSASKGVSSVSFLATDLASGMSGYFSGDINVSSTTVIIKNGGLTSNGNTPANLFDTGTVMRLSGHYFV